MRFHAMVSDVCSGGRAMGVPVAKLADMQVPWIAPSEAVVT